MKNFILVLFLGFSLGMHAQQTILSSPPALGNLQICPDQIKWTNAPAPFLPGAKMATLEGNPKNTGLFTVRFKLPPNYTIPPHFHPKDERVTVISGSVYVGFGDKKDENSAKKFTTGCFYINPVNSHHFAYTKDEEVIIQITGMGPWGITMIGAK